MKAFVYRQIEIGTFFRTATENINCTVPPSPVEDSPQLHREANPVGSSGAHSPLPGHSIIVVIVLPRWPLFQRGLVLKLFNLPRSSCTILQLVAYRTNLIECYLSNSVATIYYLQPMINLMTAISKDLIITEHFILNGYTRMDYGTSGECSSIIDFMHAA